MSKAMAKSIFSQFPSGRSRTAIPLTPIPPCRIQAFSESTIDHLNPYLLFTKS